MNMNFKCDNCGAGMSASIWDDSVQCPHCGTEHVADVKRTGSTSFVWFWAAAEGSEMDPGTGEDWASMDLAQYLETSTRLVDAVRIAQNNGELLKVSSAAERFNVTWDTVVNMADDRGLNINVGVQAGGHGGPVGSIPMADWTLEDLDAYE